MIPDEELSVQAGYALWASLYDDDGNPLVAIEGPALAQWYGPIHRRPVLDLGCGTGRHSSALAQAGAVVIAADPTPEMLGRARTHLTKMSSVGLLRLGLPGPLPFRDATFELAVMALVAEHLVDLDASFAEIARVLKPGGRLLLSILHPERTAEGQTARFIDPETGVRRRIRTMHREIDDYLGSAKTAGFSLLNQRSLLVPADLAERLPRAAPYVGKPLGWVAHWMR